MMLVPYWSNLLFELTKITLGIVLKLTWDLFFTSYGKKKALTYMKLYFSERVNEEPMMPSLKRTNSWPGLNIIAAGQEPVPCIKCNNQEAQKVSSANQAESQHAPTTRPDASKPRRSRAEGQTQTDSENASERSNPVGGQSRSRGSSYARSISRVRRHDNYNGTWTELHKATKKGNLMQVIRIVSAGHPIDPKIETDQDVPDKGKTPLCIAIEHKHIAIAKLLLERGADWSIKVDSIITPLLLAIDSDFPELIEIIIPYAGVNYTIPYLEMSLLSYSLWQAKLSSATCLLSMGASYRESSPISGMRPLCYAASTVVESKSKSTVNLLIEHVMNLEKPQHIQSFLNLRNPKDGKTALHEACKSGNYGAIQILLKYGADKTAQDFGGKSCYCIVKDEPDSQRRKTMRSILFRPIDKIDLPKVTSRKANCMKRKPKRATSLVSPRCSAHKLPESTQDVTSGNETQIDTVAKHFWSLYVPRFLGLQQASATN